MARPPLTGHNTIFLDTTGPPQQGRRRGPLSEAHAFVEGGGHQIGTHEEYVRQRGGWTRASARSTAFDRGARENAKWVIDE